MHFHIALQQIEDFGFCFSLLYSSFLFLLYFLHIDVGYRFQWPNSKLRRLVVGLPSCRPGLSSRPGHAMWELRWISLLWDGFISQYFSLPHSVPFHQCSALILSSPMLFRSASAFVVVTLKKSCLWDGRVQLSVSFTVWFVGIRWIPTHIASSEEHNQQTDDFYWFLCDSNFTCFDHSYILKIILNCYESVSEVSKMCCARKPLGINLPNEKHKFVY